LSTPKEVDDGKRRNQPVAEAQGYGIGRRGSHDRIEKPHDRRHNPKKRGNDYRYQDCQNTATMPAKSRKQESHHRINHEHSAEINGHGNQRNGYWLGHGFAKTNAIDELPIIRMTRDFKSLQDFKNLDRG
jgi:hypothetical protein